MKSSSPSISLAGRRILITGGARGLGAAFAEQACAAGARVVIADVLSDKNLATAETLAGRGFDISACTVDLENADSIRACAHSAVQMLGGLDALINNGAIATGIGGVTGEKIDIDTWDRVMRVNVRGTWLMSTSCLPALRESGNGKILNIASDTALWGAPRLMHYVASKGAVIAMTRAMAREVGNDGIAVNAIAPGLTVCEATEYVPRERKDHYVSGRAMNREQVPEDVVGAALFFVSDAASFVTGQTLPVNGGFVLN